MIASRRAATRGLPRCPHRSTRKIILRTGRLLECQDCGRILDPES